MEDEMKKGKYPQMRIDDRLYSIVELYSQELKEKGTPKPMSKVMTDIYNEHQQMFCVLTEIIQGHPVDLKVGIMEKIGKKTLIQGPLVLNKGETIVLAVENHIHRPPHRLPVEPTLPKNSTESKAPEAERPQEPGLKVNRFTYHHSDGSDHEVIVVNGTARISNSLLRKVIHYTPDQRLELNKEILSQYRKSIIDEHLFGAPQAPREEPIDDYLKKLENQADRERVDSLCSSNKEEEYYLTNPKASESVAVFTKTGQDSWEVSATLSFSLMMYRDKMTTAQAQAQEESLKSVGWVRTESDGSERFTHQHVWDIYA
jgi:hypothetical protein